MLRHPIIAAVATLSITVVGVAQVRSVDPNLTARLMCTPDRLQWGEQAVFTVALSNTSRNPLEVEMREADDEWPAFAVQRVDIEGAPMRLLRSSSKAGRAEFTTSLMAPDDAREVECLLYNDIPTVGNLPVGRWMVSLSIPIRWRIPGQQWNEVVLECQPIEVDVIPARMDVADWAAFRKQLEDAGGNAGKKGPFVSDLVETFLRNHPTAPMREILEVAMVEDLRSRARSLAPQESRLLVDQAAQVSSDLTSRVRATKQMKIKVLENFIRLLGDLPAESERMKEAATKLKALDADNEHVRKVLGSK